MAKKVLVVDDEDSVRDVALSALGRGGYDGIGVPSAEKALEVTEREAVDVVLTDYMMPAMDGYQLAEALLFSDYRTKRILMSGRPGDIYADHPDMEGYFDIYFDGFLQKPFTPQQLLAELNRVLGTLEPQ